MAVGNYKSHNEMETFWSSLPAKVKSILYRPSRTLVLNSDDVPLYPHTPSRIRALPKYLLFSDIFVIIQGTMLIEYPLEWVWLDHLPVSDSTQSIIQMNNFRLILPETVIELQCKEFAQKSMWVSCIIDTLGLNLNIPQFVNCRGDLTLDTQIQLIRTREFIDYTYQTHPEMKDGRYKGPWVNAKPHGIGEYWHEPSGKLYKGCFKRGLFHGCGELLWFTDKEDKKKYIGEFTKGKMNGKGEMKYSNGDVYDGSWIMGTRSGFGTLEVASRKNSKYTGGWKEDKRNGYGVYNDKMRHERYLGLWVENQRFGPGIVITSTGTYCEATFSDGMTGNMGNDGLILDCDGSSYTGKIGPGFRLAGKGVLTLNNGSLIDGVFAGTWNGNNIEIQKGVLTVVPRTSPTINSSRSESYNHRRYDLQIARLDRRIGTCTVLASNKWLPIYEECEKMLGFSGNAASDVITAWSRIASGVFDNRHNGNNNNSDNPLLTTNDKYFQNPVRRASSLSTIPRSVRTPGELITLERARAQTVCREFREEDEDTGVESMGVESESGITSEGSEEDSRISYLKHSSLEDLEKSLLQMSIEHSIRINKKRKVEISGPLHLQEDVACSYPPAAVHISRVDRVPSKNNLTVSDSIDDEDRQQESISKQQDGQFDATAAIQKYIDKAFNTPTHPLGILMNNLEDVFRDSYSGIGANKFLLSHAIAEVQYIIKRLHSIIRILFPFLDGDDHELTNVGFHRVGIADPDDYLSIGSGYHLLHPLVFMRIFPTLIMLYILHHVDEDRRYQSGVDCLSQMDNERLVHYIRLPVDILSSPESNRGVSIIKCLDQAAKILHKLNTLYTPREFLDLFKTAFKQLHLIDNISGDLLLPSVVYIIIKAKVQHLGAYLHFLTDFAHTKSEDDYILVTYEAAYNFIQKQDSLL